MKLKYYLRGLGIGIIVTTIVLAISFSQKEVELSDEEIIARATQLGMVMQEEETDTANTTQTEETTTQEEETETQTEETTTQAEETTTQTEGMTLQTDDSVQTDTAQQEEANIPETEAEQDVADDTVDGTGEPVTGEGYRLVIKKGDVCRVVCENLAANGVISDAEGFRKYLFEIGYASNMSVGEYDIPYGLTQEEVAEILKAGPIEE